MINILHCAAMAAPGGSEQGGGGMQTLIMLGVLFAIFYFLLIRPQKKQQEKHKQLVESLKKGDKVITNGGVHGIISNVKDKTFTVKVDEGTKLEISKGSIATVIKKKDEEESKE